MLGCRTVSRSGGAVAQHMTIAHAYSQWIIKDSTRPDIITCSTNSTQPTPCSTASTQPIPCSTITTQPIPCSTKSTQPRVKADRLALCEYLLTGQLLEGEVGSVVMFAILDGFGERSMDEVFLQVT